MKPVNRKRRIPSTPSTRERKRLGPKEVWFAAAGDIQRQGPFATQREAWASMVLQSYIETGWGPVHAPGTHVWPELPARKVGQR